MFKTIILILSISSIAICVIDPKAPKPYENPWTKDKVAGKCNANEKLDSIKHAGKDYAQCMESHIYGDNEQCTPPPLFDTTKLSAYPVKIDETTSERVCVVECSMSKTECPGDALCLAAPAYLQTEQIINICYYPSPAAPTPPKPTPPKPLPTNDYENPWVANKHSGRCHKDEKLEIYENIFGRKFAQCMPILSEDMSSCPQPPAKHRHHAFAKITTVDRQDVCVNECSHSHGCDFGAYCLNLPFSRRSNQAKKACLFIKPRPWIKIEVEIDIEDEIVIYYD